MADFRLSVSTISRSAGRSATAAAAYRAAVAITCARTGVTYDYRRKRDVVSTTLFLPAGSPDWAADRGSLWNAVELAETRKNSTVAREFQLSLPWELSEEERARLAHDFAQELVERHGCVVDVAIHQPPKSGDHRNHHAHLLVSTRRLMPEGFTEKTRELDDKKTGPTLVEAWRKRYADLQNARLRESGSEARVDHRSLAARGIDRAPTQHLGPKATNYERRTGEKSKRRLYLEERASEAAAERLARIKEAADLERQDVEIDKFVLDLSADLRAAKAERDKQAATPMPLMSQAWFGWITAPEGDRALLSRLGVELGEFTELGGKFPARVDATVMGDLQPYSESFELQFTPFDVSLLNSRTRRLEGPLAHATPAVLEGYYAYLCFVVAAEKSCSWAKGEMAEVNRERRQRELELPGLRYLPKPDTLEPG